MIQQVAQEAPEDEPDISEDSLDLNTAMAAIPPAIWNAVAPQVLRAAQEIRDAAPSSAVRPTSLDGIRVHIYVQRHYRQSNTGLVLMDRRVYGRNGGRLGTLTELVKQGTFFRELGYLEQAFTSVGKAGFLGAMKPDIVDVATSEVYEIKPRARAVLGVAQLQLYLIWYNSILGTSGLTPIRPGLAYRPLIIAPLTRGKVAHVQTDPRVPGLIFYDVYAGKEAQRLQEELEASYVPSAGEMALLIVLFLGALIIEGILIADPVPGDEIAWGGVLGMLARLIWNGARAQGRLILGAAAAAP